MERNAKGFAWVAAALLLTGTLAQAQAQDLVREARYADITVGNSVATILQIGAYNQARVDQSGARLNQAVSQTGSRNQAVVNQSGVNNAVTAQQNGTAPERPSEARPEPEPAAAENTDA